MKPAPAGGTSRRLLLGLMYVETIAAFETAMIYGAIGLLYRLFGDPILVGWIIAIYMLTSACMTPLIARMGDLYGRRRVLMVVLGVVTLGSLISAISPGVEGLLIGRALQGMAGSILALCFGLWREHAPTGSQTMGTGLLAATASIASGVGVLVGGLIVDHLPWHWMFWFAALASAVGIGVALWLIPPSVARTAPSGKLDVMGGVLLVPVIAGSLYAIGQIRQWGIGDVRIWMLLGVALAIGAFWFRHEYRQRTPLIDVRLLGNRQVLWANLVMMVSAYGVFQVGPFISLVLQQTPEAGAGFGISPTLSGGILFGSHLMALLGGPAAGFVAGRHGARRALQAGALISAVGWVGMALGRNDLAVLLTMLYLQALGSVMILGSVPMVLAEAVPLERTSESNGVSAVLRQANFAIATQITAFLLSTQSVMVNGASYPGPQAMTLAFTVLAAMTVLGFALSLVLPRAPDAVVARATAT